MVYEYRFPDLGEGVTEGEIIKWLVKIGDKVKEDQVLGKIETDKAIADIPAPVSGTIKKINFKAGGRVKVGQVLLTIDTGKKETKKKHEAGVVGEIQGAEKGANVFERAAEKKSTPKEQKVKVKKKYDMYGYVTRIPFKGTRKTIAKHMVEAVTNIPLVTQTDDADVTALAEIRHKANANKKTHITFMPYIIKACVLALKKNPFLNSMLDESSEEIIQKKYYNLGFAVSTDNGLLVPVIKGADQKSITDLAKAISDLSGKARTQKINLADMKGGSFTITNIGSVGGIYATPIPNHPESAILGLGRIRKMPTAVKDEIKLRYVLPLSVTYDHRVLDGAKAAAFLNDLVKYLEKPESLK